MAQAMGGHELLRLGKMLADVISHFLCGEAHFLLQSKFRGLVSLLLLAVDRGPFKLLNLRQSQPHLARRKGSTRFDLALKRRHHASDLEGVVRRGGALHHLALA